MTKRAPAFLEWFISGDNPFANASESVRFSTKDALRAAFKAGAEYGAKTALNRVYGRVNPSEHDSVAAELLENIFT